MFFNNTRSTDRQTKNIKR